MSDVVPRADAQHHSTETQVMSTGESAPEDAVGGDLVDRTREPSQEWGWHGEFPRGALIAGWATVGIFVAIMVSRLAGTHTEGHVADAYLAVISVGMALALARTMRRRRSWRR